MVTFLTFYVFRMMIRSGQINVPHYFKQLLNQYWVDLYTKIETERLSFIRHNQKKLRAENYIHLMDAVNSDSRVENVGQLIILPSTFTGGPRYIHERT